MESPNLVIILVRSRKYMQALIWWIEAHIPAPYPCCGEFKASQVLAGPLVVPSKAPSSCEDSVPRLGLLSGQFDDVKRGTQIVVLVLLNPVLQFNNRQVTYALVFIDFCDWYLKLSWLVIGWSKDQVPEMSDTVTLIEALVIEGGETVLGSEQELAVDEACSTD